MTYQSGAQLSDAAFGTCRHAACSNCKRHLRVSFGKRRADCAPPLIVDVSRMLYSRSQQG